MKLNPGQSKLKFGKVKSGRFSATGLFHDGKGNIFTISVMGSNRELVEKAIRYFKSKKGIRINVTKGEPKSLAGGSLAPGRRYSPGKWQGLSIKISEFKVKLQKPYKITCEIDPPRYAGDPPDYYPLDGQQIADLRCDVKEGSVFVELFEFHDQIGAASSERSSATAFQRQPVIFHEGQLMSGNWCVKVSVPANVAKAYYTLRYDIVVN